VLSEAHKALRLPYSPIKTAGTLRDTMRELPLSRSVPAIRTIAALGLIACVNAAVVGFVQGRPELLPLVLAGVVALPIAAVLVVKLVERPQRGVLLLAALVPFDGLREITSFPAGWKEALVVVTLAATFVAPRESRGVPGRRLPSWAFVVAAFFLLGTASALAVGIGAARIQFLTDVQGVYYEGRLVQTIAAPEGKSPRIET